jgi:hypothetical protein
MRGRELPGFASARLLMGSVFVDLENLRSEVFLMVIHVDDVFYFIFRCNRPNQITFHLHQVDEALFRAADVFMTTANKLAERIAENVLY